MKLILSLIILLPLTSMATELDDSVWNGSSSMEAKKTVFTNDSSLFVGASTRFKAEGRLPASAMEEIKEVELLDDGIWDGTSIK